MTKNFFDPTTIERYVVLIPEEFRDFWRRYLFAHVNHYNVAFLLLNKEDKNQKILEVGSFPGHFTVFLKKQGYDITGIDIRPERAGKLWQEFNIPVYKVDVEKETFPFSNNSFETVYFIEIFEHLRINPIHALREVYRVLKPKGRIIFSTLNIIPTYRIKFLLGKDYQGDIVEEFKKLETIGHMGHFRLYSLKEVIRVLKYVGFEPLEIHYGGNVKLPRKLNRLPFIKKFFYSQVYVVAQK